jgi:hypothetical protein
MRRLHSCLLIAAVWLAPMVMDAAPPSPSDAFVLAVVRDDGVMLPVAAHDRGRWRTPWPGPAREAEVPVRLEDCPLAWWGLASPPRDWTLHVPGEAPRPVTVDGVTWTLSYCQQQVVLRSRSATRPLLRSAHGLRAPKYGVAVAGPASVMLPRAVAPESDEARSLLDALQGTFNREERLMLAEDYFAVYTPSVDADTRDRMPVRALTISEGEGRRGEPAFFVELERRYPRRFPAQLRWCDEVTYMAGWVRRGGDGRLDLTPVTRAVTSCLLDTAQRAAPLAVVRTPRGPVWLVELFRPDSEVLGVFLAPEGDDPEPLVIRPIGRCEAGQLPPSMPAHGVAAPSVP